MKTTLICREFVDFLDDYLSGTLPGGERAAFHEHLSVCPSCVSYMKTYQASIRWAREALGPSGAPVPAEVPEELVRAILASRKKP